MVRHEYDQHNIRIVIGHDGLSGYFISVYDKRLKINENAGDKIDDEFHALCFDVSPIGTGRYFEAQTGTYEPGNIVSLKVMEKLWRLYGVPEEHRDLLRQDLRCIEISSY